MKTYAEILNGIVIHIGHCADSFTPQFAPPILCVVVDPQMLPQPEQGWEYRDGAFIEPAVPSPFPFELVIDSVTGGTISGNEITTMVGTPITASGRVLTGGEVVAVFSGQFRLPIKASDGRERLILATVEAGIVSVSWTPKESGIWRITEEMVNSNQPDATKMAFTGLSVYALEAA